MPRRRIIQELVPLRRDCGLILKKLCLDIGICPDDFFRHLAEEVNNSWESAHTQTYQRCIPQSYLLDRFSTFARAVDQTVKACSTDETIVNRKKIAINWSFNREKYIDLLCEKNELARKIVNNLS